MPGFRNLTQLSVKLNGVVNPKDLSDDVLEIVVDSSLYQPDMATIRIRDRYVEWIDGTDFALSTTLEILAQVPESAAEVSIFKGEIAALEPEFAANGENVLVVRAYGQSHRLHFGRYTRTFLKMKDSDIVSRIAGDAGLSASADATSVTYEYVLQYNQTNMEFLAERANRIGYFLYADGTTLNFKNGSGQPAGPTLSFETGLASFRPRVAVAQQASEVTVHGWDVKTKTALVGTLAAPDAAAKQASLPKTGNQSVAAFKASKVAVVSAHVENQADADAQAKALTNDLNRQFVEAEGECALTPTVKAGVKITIDGVGTKYSGSYIVTSATHFMRSGSTGTMFTVNGRRPNTMRSLLDSGGGQANSRIYGVVTGVVTNLEDPDDIGRIKVKFPWMPKNNGTEIEGHWARLAAPGAGQDTKGLYYAPEVNDEVLVAFEQGDISRPFIIGGLWNGKDKPPLLKAGLLDSGKVKQRIVQSRTGHKVVIDDSEKTPGITILTKAGHKITLEDASSAPQITIVDKTGSNKIIIDSKTNDINIESAANLTIKAGANIKMTATGNLELEGANVKVTAKANADVKATASLNLEGTASSALKGATVNIQGNGPTIVKGNPVMIN